MRPLLSTMLLLGIAGCEPDVAQTGAQPSPERLAQVKVGLTKSDVLALIGSPSSTTTFGDNTWYYIGTRIEYVAFFTPDELDRQILEIDFDKTGTVSRIHNLTKANGQDVAISDQQTPTAGRELGFFEQLVGNVGRFNKKKDGGS